MPVRSLVELATAACLKNIKALQSVGDYLPYEALRHILLKVDNAWQLRQIEINSPHIEGETGELWLKLIEREFPLEYKANAYKPQHPSKWYKVWERYKREHDIALQESQRKLMASLAGLQEDKEKNNSRIVEKNVTKYLPKLPGAKRHWSQRHVPNNLTFGGGKRTSTSTGAGVMRKVRREVKELATIKGVISKAGRRPGFHQGQVMSAPEAMVDDYKRAAQPTFRSNPRPAAASAAVTEYEKRAAFISDSDEDDGDGDGSFDETARHRPVKSFRAWRSSNVTTARRPGSGAASTSPAKRPSTNPSSSTAKRGSGLLSNSYKPPSARNTVTKTISKPVSRPATESKPRPSAAEEAPPPRSTQPLPRRQTSPPPTPNTVPNSPPLQASPGGGAPGVRKRKAVDVFMRPRKRP
jgi:elongin-A